MRLSEEAMNMKYIVQSAVKKNSKEYKPMEDFCICDAEKSIFIVTDGVTQSAEDYEQITARSDAGMAAEIAARTVHESLSHSDDPAQALTDGVRLAIERVGEYNKTAKASYPPATCLVAGCIRNDRLHFAYIGDSVIFLLRSSAKIQLAEQQTEALATYRRVSGEKMTKRYLYDHVTNNIQSPYGYGVILGDMRAMDFLHIASIRLEPGDRVIISSDGLDSYLMFTPFDEIRSLSPEEMLPRSARYDEPPYAAFADDKSIIIIDAEA